MKVLTIPLVSFIPSRICTLKCKLCATFSPYYTKPYHPTMKELHCYADRLFEICEHIVKLAWGGGEPLYRKDLHQFTDYIFDNFSEKFNTVDLVTNGTIVPGDELLRSLEKYGSRLRIIISNYGPDLSANMEKCAEKLHKYLGNAKIEIRNQHSDDMYFNGWVDFDVVSPKKKRNVMQAKEHYSKCASRQKYEFCFQYLNGVMIPCPRLQWLIKLGVVPTTPKEVINLFDDTVSDDEIRERIAAVYELDMLSSCIYCNGMREDSERFTPAEQLTEEEAALYRN